jgi:hypothetical protein
MPLSESGSMESSALWSLESSTLGSIELSTLRVEYTWGE